MSALKSTRGAQYPLNAEFVFDLAGGDTLLNINGVVTAIGAITGTTFDVIGLPPGAVITSGEIVVEVASNDSSTATMAVGDSASATRYLAATSIKTAARTALVPTGYLGVGENIRITLANAGGNATAGKVSVRAQYIVRGRTNEVQNT
jgi:hypothetical protein